MNIVKNRSLDFDNKQSSPSSTLLLSTFLFCLNLKNKFYFNHLS
jgi:hypothetical protein